jgi:hypothetical protein
MSYTVETSMDGMLTNISETRYTPHVDANLQVCVPNMLDAAAPCGCVPAEGFPSGMERFSAGECPVACSGSTGTWYPISPGHCVRAPNVRKHPAGWSNSSVHNQDRVFCNQYMCENYFRNIK